MDVEVDVLGQKRSVFVFKTSNAVNPWRACGRVSATGTNNKSLSLAIKGQGASLEEAVRHWVQLATKAGVMTP